MKKQTKPKHFINKPTFPGGSKAMQKFLASHQKYPKEAREAGIEGVVHVRFTIDNKGKVIKTQIIGGLGYGCDEEAERIVKLLKFKVAKTHKLRAEFHKTIRVHFKLPKPKDTAYKYVTSKSKKVDKEKGSSYTYTVSW